MTRYTGNEPIEPFVVVAKTVRCSVEKSEPSGGSSGGGGGKGPSPQLSALNLEDLDSPRGKFAVGLLLAGALLLACNNPRLGEVAILILPGVVIYRLDARSRRIAAVPVALASMMLASKILVGGPGYANSGYLSPADATEIKTWMPLLLAGCLFYMPKFPTCTEKILLVLSLVLLLSGLLPGDGFGVIFRTTQYFLFIAISVGLGVDLTQNGRMFNSQPSIGK